LKCLPFVMFKNVKNTFLFLTFFVLFLVVPHRAQSVSWHDGYSSRKSITISNPTDSEITGYQIQVSLHQGSGTDSGSDMYLDGNVQSDFDDIRFTEDDGTTMLDYWVESVSSGVATVWIDVNSLQASGNTKIYVYYGNSGADSQSNAETVFPFYENFDTNGISDWVASTLLLDHADETGQQSQGISTSTYVSSPNSAQLHTYASCFSGPFNGVQSLITYSPGLSESDYKVEFDVKLQITGFRYSSTAAQRSRVKVDGVEKYYDELNCSGLNCTQDGDWTSESFNVTDTAISSLALYADSYDCTNGNTFYDNVRIRHYIADGPSILSSRTAEAHDSTHRSESSEKPHDPSFCANSAPASVPDLFQIDTNNSQATLYFTPLSDTATYFVSFSTQPGAEEHGAEVTLGREGVQNFTVDYLSPGTDYYFKVRGQRGCMPGGWSNIKVATTTGGAHDIASDEGQRTHDTTVLGESVEPTTQPTVSVKEIKKRPDSVKTQKSQKAEEKQSLPERITRFVKGILHR